MAKSTRNAFALWILAIACAHCGTEAALRTFVVEDLCRHSSSAWIDVSRFPSGLLTSLPFHPTDDSHRCSVRLQPSSPAGIVLSVYSYSLEPEETLIIEDSQGIKVGLVGHGELPDERKSFDSDGAMRIHYTREENVTSSSQHANRIKFSLVFTQVHNAPCRSGEFQCRNRKCIPEKYACDGHNHCGDRSDQEDCSPRRQKEEKDERVPDVGKYQEDRVIRVTNYWSIGIAVAGCILAVVVIAFVAAIIKAAVDRRKKKNKEPQVVEPSAPPADPSVFGRIRQSLRGLRRPAGAAQSPARVEEAEAQNSTYHSTPSMYPQLPQAPAPEATAGHDNPEFKIEE